MANLERRPGYKGLQSGDPWTFLGCTPEQMAQAQELLKSGEGMEANYVGLRTTRWFATNEPGRIFRVVRIHDALHAVETIYLGFEKEPGSMEVEDDA